MKKVCFPAFFARQGRLAHWWGCLAPWWGCLAPWWDRPLCLSMGDLS
ncbi:MAG TPA: hypothetical protein PKJ23_00735 [bacterium]|nr:hypothetical protein [bacterium]